MECCECLFVRCAEKGKNLHSMSSICKVGHVQVNIPSFFYIVSVDFFSCKLDAVLPTAAGGVFLGGAIAPGPGTLAEGLTQAGARLPDFTLRADAPALGRSTEEALQAGVVVGFRGARSSPP